MTDDILHDTRLDGIAYAETPKRLSDGSRWLRGQEKWRWWDPMNWPRYPLTTNALEARVERN